MHPCAAQLLTVPFISQVGSSFCTLVLVDVVQSVRPACPPPSLLPRRAASLVGRQGLPCHALTKPSRGSHLDSAGIQATLLILDLGLT